MAAVTLKKPWTHEVSVRLERVKNRSIAKQKAKVSLLFEGDESLHLRLGLNKSCLCDSASSVSSYDVVQPLAVLQLPLILSLVQCRVLIVLNKKVSRFPLSHNALACNVYGVFEECVSAVYMDTGWMCWMSWVINMLPAQSRRTWHMCES